MQTMHMMTSSNIRALTPPPPPFRAMHVRCRPLFTRASPAIMEFAIVRKTLSHAKLSWMFHEECTHIKHASLHAATIAPSGVGSVSGRRCAHLSPVSKAVEGQVVRAPARVPVLDVAPVLVEGRAAACLDGRRRGRAAVLRRPTQRTGGLRGLQEYTWAST